MSAYPGFICVGGPYDGQWMPQSPGQTEIVVPRPVPSRVISRYVVDSGFWPGDEYFQTDISQYVLEEHDVHGNAWVFQP